MASSSQAHGSTTELASISSSNATSSRTDQPLGGRVPTETISADNNSGAMSTLQLVGVIAASVVAVLTILVLICYRRRRYASKLSIPADCSVFQGVTSLTPSSNIFEASSASTGTNTPQPSLRHSSRLSAEEVVELHVAQEEPVSEILPTGRGTQPFRTTSLVSGRSLLSASFLMRGFRTSLPGLAAFRSSRASRDGRVTTENELHALRSSGPTQTVYSRKLSVSTPIEHRNTEDGVWRNFSDTSWSIGLDSDSETEGEWSTVPAGFNTHVGTSILDRNRLSTLSDNIMDIEEEKKNLDVSSLDDSSRRRDCDTSTMGDFSPRSERGISAFGDSSPRRVRGLSALDDRWKTNSIGEASTNFHGILFSSNGSDYSSACSLISFDSDYGSDSDDSLQEEEF